ncbi:MAG: CPBP family intramembrane glutamic endopeptidase [Planctomycetota bacterium]
METIVEEPIEPTLLQIVLISLVLFSTSIWLLRLLDRRIQKSNSAIPTSSNSSPPWDLSAVFLFFGLFLLGQIAVVTFATIGQEDTANELSHPAVYLGFSLVNLTVAIFVILTYRLWQKQSTKVSGQTPVNFWLGSSQSIFKALKLGVLALLCWVPGHLAVAGLWTRGLKEFEYEIHAQESVTLLSDAVNQSNWLLIISLCFYAVVMAPITEEILFRGILFRWLQNHWGFLLAIVISSIAFATIHFSLASWGPLAALGALCSWLYYRSGQLLASVAVHVTFNAITILLVFSFPENF